VRLLRLIVVLGAIALVATACGHQIGDDCKTSADCDPNGTRACDLSQPGGYCTIAGCDETSCPSGSTCIRYFPQKDLFPAVDQAKSCDPMLEDIPPGDGGVAEDVCAPDEVCVEIDNMVSMGGLCAKRSYEQRECAKSCSDDGDCRGSEYECRMSGTLGSLVLATSPTVTTKFCAPRPPVTAAP
jgi:hypothetical protein